MTSDLYLTGEYWQYSLFPLEKQPSILEDTERLDTMLCTCSASQAEIDHFLRLGSNTDHCREILVAELQKNKSTADLSARMKELYHGGYGIQTNKGEFAAWYAEDGIHIALGRTARYTKAAQVISWEEAAERVRQLVMEGDFATNAELVETENFERMQLAQSLWFLSQNLTETAREQGYLAILKDYCIGGFPDDTERLSQSLKDNDFREQLKAEFDTFLDAYASGEKVLRFRYRYPHRFAISIAELDLPRLSVSTKMTGLPEVGHFITEDEIDDALTSGGTYVGSANRTYAFFRESHTTKEKVEHLMNEYGQGGHTHALSGSTGSYMDHSSKGMKLEKLDCVTVELSWSKVADRFDDLIQTGRYFPAKEAV